MSAEDAMPSAMPVHFVELAIGFGVLVFAERNYCCDKGYSQTHLDLTYEGYPDDLLRARIITSRMLTAPGKGHHYTDPGGRNVRIARRWVERDGDGQPYRYLTVGRQMDVDELQRWPSGPAALAAYDRWFAWERAEAKRRGNPPGWVEAAHSVPDEAAPTLVDSMRPPRPALRLVIDNTREVTP